ncbi:MAG TPA: translation elongation factor 4 [Candidatus Saccharimonadales bacterium]|jgi:GTP-binding protein LepA
MDAKLIRNFSIIAHIDHGKSTLADRLMELTKTVEKRDMKEQLLDKMDLEREKGITIKLAPVRMEFKGFELNLIDTPGHVDFSYEVSRSLEACEGAVLVVDATQGIQAQTLANVYLAINAGLVIIPVINKIDLPAADIDKTSDEIISLLGVKKEDICLISAKSGLGVNDLLEQIVKRVPAPETAKESATRCLIFDSYYDDYRGVILYIRVFDGQITQGDQIQMIATQAEGLALEVGVLKPANFPTHKLASGEIGYIVTNLKTTHDAKVGDTITLKANPAQKALPGYKDVRPFVYAGFFPASSEQYRELKDAIEKLSMSDSSLQYENENSPVLGFGLRVGFLGLLHMDIVRERLEREYNLNLVVTNPSTDYLVKLTNGESLDIKSAAELPEASAVAEIKEPWVKGEIVVPDEYVGSVITLLIGKRGLQTNIDYVDKQALIGFRAPLANLLTDFYDQLKSLTSGFGSYNYEIDDYKPEDLVKLDFLIASEKVDSLSLVVHRSEAESLGRVTVKKLKDIIPRQNFQVAIQAAIGGRIIAREDLSAFRKDVTTGLYGGDVSRKKKVLAKQKKGKSRMKRFGKVDIPAEAFSVMLQRD